MSCDRSLPFANNWAYLKTELGWLERLLMVAVARQRKDLKTAERIAQTKADRATSYWWQGIVSLEGVGAGDTPANQRERDGGQGKVSQQQQLETRIQASQQQGVILGLPTLVTRLNLTLFEKNLVLMALAPEINRHYSQLYSYLQGQDGRTSLPNIELILRLLCRNDEEWRTARSHLPGSPLVQTGLVKLLAQEQEPLLACAVKLAEPLITYLLADQPAPSRLESLLPVTTPSRSGLHWELAPTQPSLWNQLILPDQQLAKLDRLGQALQPASSPDNRLAEGAIALWVGPAGTGKTTAARAFAQRWQTDLAWVDLAQVDPIDQPQLLREIQATQPTLLLIRSAQVWLGRSSPLSLAQVAQFLADRRQPQRLTLLTSEYPVAVPQVWRSGLDAMVEFPWPDRRDRLQLWRQALSAYPLAPGIDWQVLAQPKLTPREIARIAAEAVRQAQTNQPDAFQITMTHLTWAVASCRLVKGQPL